ncbi:MAG: PqqD family peptide modification chaperone [Chitinivibrionales bacterium]|nr:PqqD family peptide modification chaperone [Chitinivibrionales bacterium]
MEGVEKLESSTQTMINPDIPVSLPAILSAVPTRNSAVEENDRGQTVVLQVPLKKTKWYTHPPVSWVLPFSKYRRVALDELGKEVWDACDGVQTMERIIEMFAERHFLSFHEARLSVMEFVRQLMRRGMLVLVRYAVQGG